MAESIIKMIASKSFDLFDNMDFYAANLVVSDETISSVNKTGYNSNIHDFGSASSPNLVGFATYKELSIFIFETKILMFTADTEEFNEDPTFTVIDFCVWYHWLLCFAANGTILYVDLDDLTTWGENTTIRGDTNFLATGSTLFSVVNHMNFILFSRSDGYLLWTKALITLSPANWTLWSDIAWSANYYYVGEPLHLGSYSNVIGLNYNVYAINFTKVEDSIGLVTKKLYASFGADKNICFSNRSVYVFTTNSLREYVGRGTSSETDIFKENKVMFSNVEITHPCKRVYNPTFKVHSILGESEDYFVHLAESSKLFLDTYLYSNGDDFYCLLQNSLPLSAEKWTPIQMETWDEILCTSRTWDFYAGTNKMAYFKFAGEGDTMDDPPNASLNFLSHGSMVSFGYYKVPEEIDIQKTTIIWDKEYVETAKIKSSTYPYAVFRGRGVDDFFDITIKGSFIINAMNVGYPDVQNK